MMRIPKKVFLWLIVTTIVVLSGCGGSGSGGDSGSTGVLVDPYISGAILQEVAEDGTTLQRGSTATDAQGHFEFSAEVQVGSIIETKISQLGTHVGEPNQVVLRRQIRANDDGLLVVSPLTTLIANGSTETDVVALLQTAGLTDFSAGDIYIDPMSGLDNLSSSATSADLTRLQAAMAVANYLEATNKPKSSALDMNTSSEFQIFTSCLDAVQETLSPELFAQITAAQNNSGLTMQEFVNASVTYTRPVIAMMKAQLTNNGSIDPVALHDEAMSASSDMLNNMSGQNPGNGAPNGTTLYASDCAVCHGDLANSNIPGRSADAIQTAIDQNLGGMSIYANLTTAEIQAIAAVLPVPQPTDPTQPVDGTTLYGNMCASCHSALANTTIQGNTASAIQSAIDQNVGNMGFLSTLTTEEVQAIADVLPGATPVDPTQPVDGATVYSNSCASCHGALASTSIQGRTASSIQSAIDQNIGNMGFLSTLTTEEVQAVADVLPTATPVDPTQPVDGTALYTSECAGCHGTLANTNKPGRTATDIQSAIDQNVGNMGFLSTLTSEEVQAIADVLPAAPPVDPTQPVDGAALYATSCASCHGTLANTNKPGRTATAIQTAIDQNVGNMGFLSTLTTEEVQAIADVLPAAPPVDPTQPVDGAALYSTSCASCHGTLANTNKPGRTATAIQTAIDQNVGNMGFLSTLTTEEVQAIADALPAAPPVDPTQPVDGAALYSTSCASCHGTLADTNKPGRTAPAIQSAIDQNVGNMGFLSTLTTEEVQAIADVLPATNGNSGPDYSDCTACHAQPPNGTSEPNIDGAHSAHKAIASIGTDCQICHTGASHNGSVDLGFPADYNSAYGAATDNLDGTCSNISCHGGKTTPDWWSGSISLTADCTSCHNSSAGEYISQTSGRHRKHSRYSCTTCHNSTRMPNHIGDLLTDNFEVSAASTVGGSGTSVGSYSNGSCSSIACHGSERW